MDFPKFQRLVEERSGFRTMEDATASGEYFSDSCGDMYNFFLRVGPGAVIEDISYFTTGCGFGTATCSLVVDLARGKTIDEAATIAAADVEAQLGGYPEKKKDYPERALEALHVAIGDYRAKVAAGTIPDYALMPANQVARQPETTPAPSDGKPLIKLR
jgi:nitrogen fixation protein NifU and related proteins